MSESEEEFPVRNLPEDPTDSPPPGEGQQLREGEEPNQDRTEEDAGQVAAVPPEPIMDGAENDEGITPEQLQQQNEQQNAVNPPEDQGEE